MTNTSLDEIVERATESVLSNHPLPIHEDDLRDIIRRACEEWGKIVEDCHVRNGIFLPICKHGSRTCGCGEKPDVKKLIKDNDDLRRQLEHEHSVNRELNSENNDLLSKLEEALRQLEEAKLPGTKNTLNLE